MQLRDKIAARVKKLRGDMAQEKLAAKAGVSTATVNHIENAEANPTLDVLTRIAEALGVNVEALVKP